MNILITGSNGQLGNEVRVLSAQHSKHRYFFTDVAELDITDNQAVSAFVAENAIDLIVNCAAYTNVDKAEEDEATAMKINAEALSVLGGQGVRVIHVSTDYVFSGDEHVPCRESDPVAPRTAYGRTKYEGEKRLLAVCQDAVILRTAWLYSSFGNNFVKTMIRLGHEKETLGVVFDQIGTPTYAADLAQAIFTVIESPVWHPGIYHFTNEGVCSWYDFTITIHELAGIKTCKVSPILSEEYQYRTPRPHYSVLDKSKFKKTFGVEIPYWLDGLKRCMKELEQ
ncbi:MAG: dTDP-4-dehydrorhamnose reductase [Paludibacteraceae bacterium]|nr:dTDP-4-dehydrorhamnose reductase [Paludibacteraceae bacterium]MBQ2190371.1 dTDP-4-dehydrorhamnose reductase [Paludibacteraceae bacterium]